MTKAELVQLEGFINSIPGVLSCVILTTPQGEASEIQVFTAAGADPQTIRESISGRIEQMGAGRSLRQVHVFELEGESGGRGALERMIAELATEGTGEREATISGDRRPSLERVDLSSPEEPVALVSLREGEQEFVGRARGPLGARQLQVIAEATLQAVERLVPGPKFTPVDVSQVRWSERDVVVALIAEEGGAEMLGAVLVRRGSVSEATVRATLDAVNRRLQRAK